MFTLSETNIAPANRSSQKERIVFQPSFFQVQAASFREGTLPETNIAPKNGGFL